MKYRPEIDGLRALAIVPVIFFHAGFDQFSGGFVGVDIFFVISGFLITSILVSEMDEKRFSIVHFYERRARRILPALFFVAAMCIPFAWVLLPPSEMKRFSDSLVSVATFSSNFLFWRQSGYFDTANELKPLIHTWSLAVEEQFYILFPVFLLLIYSVGKRAVTWILIALFGLSFGLSQAIVAAKPSAAFFLLPTRGWELLLGAFCALSRKDGRTISSVHTNLVSVLGMGMVLVAIFAFDHSTPTPSFYTLLPTVGAALILLYASGSTLTGKVLGSKPLVGIGLISYSTYLWHQPILVYLRYAMPGQMNLELKSLALFSALSVGYVSWKYIETPFRNRQKVSLKSVTAAGLAGAILIGAFGLAGHVSDGFHVARASDPLIVRDQALQQVRTERQTQIRAGICHFDENLPIAKFISNWNCRSDDENLFDSRIMVLGDSHGADKVVALRLNGVDVWQLTGAGCEVAPDFIKDDRKYCGELFRLAESHQSDLKGVIIANRFALHELTDEYIEGIFRYWGQMDLPVVLFAPMPEFPQQQQEYAVKGTTTVPPLFEREAKFFELIKRHAVPSNMLIIKSSDYWCAGGSNNPSNIETCAVAINGEYLMTDEDHLSRRGAELFGKALMQDQRFRTVLGIEKALSK